MLTHIEPESFHPQQSIFAVLNLFVLAALLLLHTLFSEVLGSPAPLLLVALGGAFLLKLMELLWLQARAGSVSSSTAAWLNWASIALNLCLALLFTLLTNRIESPYFVLLALPVLQAAFYFGLVSLLAVIVIADSMMFFWVWHFSTYHPPVPVGEYLEAGVIALIYSLVGLLVWSLIRRIRRDQSELQESMKALEQTRTQLAREEKLAAVGRLSSAIAHEIRNPVAMIASAMSTADSPGVTAEARLEMYAIASSEAARLERLTTDFLSYARPGTPNRARTSIADLLGYIVEIAGPHAMQKGLRIDCTADSELFGNVDAAQLQRALLNLVMNALDEASPQSTVHLRGTRWQNGLLSLEVENEGTPIPEQVLARIFEPFYTTKTHGTGLGLAIARNIACAHGGDLFVSTNEGGRVCFTMVLKEDDAPDKGEQ